MRCLKCGGEYTDEHARVCNPNWAVAADEKIAALTAERDRYRVELERLMDLVGEVDRDLIEKCLSGN
jgi:hypothetical protein